MEGEREGGRGEAATCAVDKPASYDVQTTNAILSVPSHLYQRRWLRENRHLAGRASSPVQGTQGQNQHPQENQSELPSMRRPRRRHSWLPCSRLLSSSAIFCQRCVLRSPRPTGGHRCWRLPEIEGNCDSHSQQQQPLEGSQHPPPRLIEGQSGELENQQQARCTSSTRAEGGERRGD